MRASGEHKTEKGVAALEFALVAMPTVLLLLGVVEVGINLGRAVTVDELCRDADSMYVRGVDFSTTAAQNLLVQIGQNLNLQTGSTSSGLVILSEVQFVPLPIGCTTTCTTGAGSYQLMQQQIIGNTLLPGTHFPTAGSIPSCGGTTTTNCQDSQGNIQGYQTFSNATITNFGSSLTLQNYGISYVAEVYFLSGANLQIWYGAPGFYAQSFF
ncbi:MAG TPA: TadE/TadG family type IV pilus assembly protein [Bryobacteraceae bacterium]|nr:TadE/TadG family type IV pilus assembly protein [Bryobacteraceae bacterium]